MPNFYQYFKDAGFPKQIHYKQKCICLFQNIDGIDVLEFVMFVYESDYTCEEPNARKSYISYLDRYVSHSVVTP